MLALDTKRWKKILFFYASYSIMKRYIRNRRLWTSRKIKSSQIKYFLFAIHTICYLKLFKRKDSSQISKSRDPKDERVLYAFKIRLFSSNISWRFLIRGEKIETRRKANRGTENKNLCGRFKHEGGILAISGWPSATGWDI